MQYLAAKIVGGVVTELIVTASNSVDDIPAGFIEAPEGTGIGYTDNGDGTFSPPAEPTPVLTADDYTRAVQLHLDSEAQGLGYDNIFTAVTYADEPAVPLFQTQGQALRAWRSTVWAECYVILDDVTNELRTAPTVAELIAELTAFTPPA